MTVTISPAGAPTASPTTERFAAFLTAEVEPLEADLARQDVGSPWNPRLDEAGPHAPRRLGGAPGGPAPVGGGRALQPARRRRRRRRRVHPRRDAARRGVRVPALRARAGPGRAGLDRGRRTRRSSTAPRGPRAVARAADGRRDHRGVRQHRDLRRHRRPGDGDPRAPRRLGLDPRRHQGLDHQRALRRRRPGHRRHRARRRHPVAVDVPRRRERARVLPRPRHPDDARRRPHRRAALRRRAGAGRERRRRGGRRVRAGHGVDQLATPLPRRDVRRLGRVAAGAGDRPCPGADLGRAADRRAAGGAAHARRHGRRRVRGAGGVAAGAGRARRDARRGLRRSRCTPTRRAS